MQKLAAARRRLEAVQREQAQALSKVGGPLGCDNKRNWEGERKEEDNDGDVDMVPNLTGLQVVTLFASRMRDAEEQVRHLQILLAREEVTPPEVDDKGGGQCSGGAADRAAPCRA